MVSTTSSSEVSSTVSTVQPLSSSYTTASASASTTSFGTSSSSTAVATAKIVPSGSHAHYNGGSHASVVSQNPATGLRAAINPQQQMYRQNVGMKGINGSNLDSPSSLTGSNQNGNGTGEDYSPHTSAHINNPGYPSITASSGTGIHWSSQNQGSVFRQPMLQGPSEQRFGSLATSSAALAAANLGSLSNAFNSDAVMDRGAQIRNQSPAYSMSSSIPNPHAQASHQMYNSSSAFSPLNPVSLQNQRFTPNHLVMTLDPRQQSPAPSLATQQQSEKIAALQRELEQERAQKYQIQQRFMDLSQRLYTQQLLEKSYEELTVKYKHAITQLQQMSIVIERYKSVIKQLEQEKRLLVSENSSLKAQENVAHDKTMLYNILLERSKKLEEENSSLVLENETYQRQYEKSFDEISRQVVQALITQKALQEQCLQLQERLVDVERENTEYGEVVRQARQASSDSRLGWSYKSGRNRAKTASPSADSVRSMPAQHLYWRQGSINSLEHQQAQQSGSTSERIPEHAKLDSKEASGSKEQFICVETEFPANNGSPKSTRRNLERHPSSGSLDSAYHTKGFVKHTGHDVRCQRSVSAEALRDMKVNMRRTDLILPSSIILPTSSAAASNSNTKQQQVTADVHKDLSPTSPPLEKITSLYNTNSTQMTDSGVVNDPFADDADDILSKHQSLIIGSTEDIFSSLNGDLKNEVIHEEDTSAETSRSTDEAAAVAPTPPPRPRSRCLSDCSFTTDSKSSHYDQLGAHAARHNEDSESGPPPLPPKQYKGSRRPYKPLPAEPIEPDIDDDLNSSDKNTDSESIKQEINELTSKIARMAASVKH